MAVDEKIKNLFEECLTDVVEVLFIRFKMNDIKKEDAFNIGLAVLLSAPFSLIRAILSTDSMIKSEENKEKLLDNLIDVTSDFSTAFQIELKKAIDSEKEQIQADAK